MHISLILAHPEQKSFNHAIALRAKSTLEAMGHHVHYHDLYQEGFEPLLTSYELGRSAILSETLERHCCEIAQAEGIIIVHPNWWGQPPAILKGWVDRVFRPGVAYAFVGEDGGEGIPVGLLRAKSAIVFNTTNTDATREQNIFGDPLETLWRNCIFGLCGVKNVIRRNYGIVITSNERERSRWLEDVEKTVECIGT